MLIGVQQASDLFVAVARGSPKLGQKLFEFLSDGEVTDVQQYESFRNTNPNYSKFYEKAQDTYYQCDVVMICTIKKNINNRYANTSLSSMYAYLDGEKEFAEA